MSRTFHHGKRKSDREERLRAIKRDKATIRRLGRTALSLTEAELEKEAQEQARRAAKKKRGRS